MAHCPFLKIFPPPHFLEVEWVGLDISDESVKLIQLVDGMGGLKLGKFSERPLPAGVMNSGQIVNKEKLIEVLKGLRKDSPTQYVNASLPEEKSFLFTVDVPGSDNKEEIRQNIEFVLEENIPISPADTLFEFDIIGKSEKDSSKVTVSVTAMPISVVEDYSSVISAAGFNPYSLEVEGRAISRAVVAKGDPRTLLVVNFNERNAGMFLVSNGIIRYTNTVRLDDRNSQNSGLAGSPDSLNDFIVKEIEKVTAYWNANGVAKRDIEAIVIIGKYASDNNFLAYLKKNSVVRVENADAWANVCGVKNSVPVIEKKDSIRFVTAIGLALKSR